ncbi:MAG TPA: M28 family metallopeptidase [Terriglobia bacterium]|nr:M28 family metallopeptidase [Terriglobia bacterium]
MRRFGLIAVLCVACVGLTARAAEEHSSRLMGFSAQASETERHWEEKFKGIPEPENMRAYMQRLSAFPHHVGSPYDKSNAEWILSKFKEFGLDAHMETFYVLFPTPKERKVEMVAPSQFVAKLQEPTMPGDPTSDQHATQLPTYNAYSIDGDVTAPLVYVNYGVPSDYKMLESLGISVKGAIVIARYGQSWRGVKPKVAAEHGAVGCLIYSDPHEDGYFQGDVYPHGAFRPLEGVQRGSVMDITQYSGDPLTPGVGATKSAHRIPLKELKVLSPIPTLPLSYGDAKPLLEALAGQVAPANWRGGLGLTYHLGPGPVKVHMIVKANWDLKPVYDVIARIPGSEYPDEWIVRGNHHDAWVNGAEDPVSGQVSLLEEARALGALLNQGWKPRRTVIYCAWDGEEPGLLGSTEWAEEHASELEQHAAAYINTDLNGRGYLGVEGSHTLQKFINGVARDIQDPEKNISVWQRERDLRIRRAKTPAERQALRQNPDLKIGALGSGSDYTVFIDHLGVASLMLSYGGESNGAGIYHSIYDDFYWFSHFDDIKFIYGRAMAQTVGTTVMRLADADILPLDYSELTDTVRSYVNELKELLRRQQAESKELNTEIQEGVFSATSDPQKPFVEPKPEDFPPFLNFAPLDNGVAALDRSADHFQKAMQAVESNGGAALAHASLAHVNQLIIGTERKLTRPEGLPGRAWYRHELYAPGVYTGYDVKTLPGVREAIEQRRWEEAGNQIVILGKVLEDEAQQIEAVASNLEETTQ